MCVSRASVLHVTKQQILTWFIPYLLYKIVIYILSSIKCMRCIYVTDWKDQAKCRPKDLTFYKVFFALDADDRNVLICFQIQSTVWGVAAQLVMQRLRVVSVVLLDDCSTSELWDSGQQTRHHGVVHDFPLLSSICSEKVRTVELNRVKCQINPKAQSITWMTSAGLQVCAKHRIFPRPSI